MTHGEFFPLHVIDFFHTTLKFSDIFQNQAEQTYINKQVNAQWKWAFAFFNSQLPLYVVHKAQGRELKSPRGQQVSISSIQR